MMRRHFVTLAWELRNACPQPGPAGSQTGIESDWYAGQSLGWDRAVVAVANACAFSNGNFDRGRFLVAAGYTHRPDGSMYPMAAPR